jgi:dipeptidyl aminopeptidase/acylaminoacyl peptidase
VTIDGTALKTVDRQGREKTVFKSIQRWEPIYAWPMWSPDSQRLAVVTIEWCNTGSRISSLQIIDVRSEESAKHGRYDFWEAQGTTDGPERFSLPKKLRWSPDGKKILVSWDQAVVIDADTGEAEIVSTEPVIAEWAPGSDAVYYFEIKNPETKGKRALGDFYVKRLGAQAPVKLMDENRLEELGLATGNGVIPAFMTLSPGGSRLAIGSGLSGESTGTTPRPIPPAAHPTPSS